jgi:uncharacterized membrane protein YczE
MYEPNDAPMFTYRLCVIVVSLIQLSSFCRAAVNTVFAFSIEIRLFAWLSSATQASITKLFVPEIRYATISVMSFFWVSSSAHFAFSPRESLTSAITVNTSPLSTLYSI